VGEGPFFPSGQMLIELGSVTLFDINMAACEIVSTLRRVPGTEPTFFPLFSKQFPTTASKAGSQVRQTPS